MDMFDPRYQLEAEEQAAPQRSSLSHQEILHTLDALDNLACRLRKQRARRQRRMALFR